MPDLLVSTMPSGSTRLTVTSLYSFPVSVLKSSAGATEMKDRIKKVRGLICIRMLRSLGFCPQLWFASQGKLPDSCADMKNRLRSRPARLPLHFLSSNRPLRWTLHFLQRTCELGCAQFLR